MTALLLVLAALLVVAGLAGLFLPVLPGHVLILGGLVLAAWAEGFQHVGGWTLGLLVALAGIAYGLDFVAGAVGAKRFGATRWAVIGATLGAIVGIFFGLPGLLLGPLIGAVAGELATRRPLAEASRAGIGATLGVIVGGAIKVALAIVMLVVFAVARLL